MAGETMVTLQGWLGTNVAMRQAGDSLVASFRVACTPRRFHRRTGEWADGQTQWYTVNAWRGLAETCAASLHRGDPVVVHGRLDASVWKNASGEEMVTMEVDALMVGHDLSRGTSVFTRTPRQEGVREQPRAEEEPAA